MEAASESAKCGQLQENDDGAGRDDAVFVPGTTCDLRTDDFGEMEAMLPPNWTERYWQIGRGRFKGSLFIACTSHLTLANVSWAPGIGVSGDRADGVVEFAMPVRRCGAACVRGREVRDDEGVLLYPGEETDFRTAAPVEVIAVAVERGLFERASEAVLGRPVDSLRRDARLALIDADGLRSVLMTFISTLRKELSSDTALLRDPILARRLESEVLNRLLSGLKAPETCVDSSRRRALAWGAETFLRDNLSAALTVSDVCNAVGASERTLHRAFRELFGMSPKAYLKTLRLNAVRRDLRSGDPACSVTQVATRWGFWHLGWFSRDYGIMFGESPSETIRNGGQARPAHGAHRDGATGLAVFG